MVAWSAIECPLSLEEAPQQFVNCDWCQSAVSYLIPAAEVVERLAYSAPPDPEERRELEARVLAFFWEYLDGVTAPADASIPPQTYPLCKVIAQFSFLVGVWGFRPHLL